MTTATPKFVVVYHALDVAQAYVVKAALEDAGIAVQVENESLQSGVGELPPGWLTAPLVLVDESDVVAAKEIIGRGDAHANAARSDENEVEVDCCLSCGAVMPDSETKCAACGWSYEGETIES